MIFPDVLGHERAKAALARLLASNRLPHAFLFHGPEGVGKALVARLFVGALMCERPLPSGAGCGACPACLRAGHGNHPDVFLITRLPRKDKRADAGEDEGDEDEAGDAPGGKASELRAHILVQQVRELSHHATFAPREARRRVFLVDPADRMNAESQNALLKTLEEPPGQAVIVLVSSRPHVLFPTVRSRCFQIGFGAMPPDQLATALRARGIAPVEASARAALAEGRPGRALALDLAALTSRREAILASLEALAASPRAAAELSVHAERLGGDGEADLLEGLELATALLRDAARTASGGRSILHFDLAPRIARLGRTLGAGRAADVVALADRLRGELRLNLNRALVCEALLAAVAGAPLPSFA